MSVSALQEEIIYTSAAATRSLSDLAKQAKISDETLSSWRRGLRVPTPDAIAVLADVLEEQTAEILSGVQTLREAAKEMAGSAGGRAKWLQPSVDRRLRYEDAVRRFGEPEPPSASGASA